MNLISSYHPDRPIRQRFRDHMLETIMDRYNNEELYTFNLKVTPKEELELYEMSLRKDKLKVMAGEMVSGAEVEVEGMLKKVLAERFNNC